MAAEGTQVAWLVPVTEAQAFSLPTKLQSIQRSTLGVNCVLAAPSAFSSRCHMSNMSLSANMSPDLTNALLAC